MHLPYPLLLTLTRKCATGAEDRNSRLGRLILQGEGVDRPAVREAYEAKLRSIWAAIYA